MFLLTLIRGALIAVLFIVVIVLMLKFIKRKVLRGILVTAFCVLAVLWSLNPGRADFSNAVFEGGKPNPMVKDQNVMNEILETETKYFQNHDDPHVRQENYLFFSIYDVEVSSSKTYRVLGILRIFRVLNP